MTTLSVGRGWIEGQDYHGGPGLCQTGFAAQYAETRMAAPAAAGGSVKGGGLSATIRTLFWMSGALSCFIVMALAGREAIEAVSPIEVLMFRAFIATGVVLLILIVTGEGFGVLRTRRILTHLGRNTFQFGGQMAWFYALSLIPLAQVFAYEFTAPIWVAVLAPLVLGERMTLARVIAALLGFAGVLIVARPGYLAFNSGAAVMLLGAIGFAGAMLGTKMLAPTEKPITIVFYMGALQIPITLVLAWPYLERELPIIYAYLTLITLAGMGAHYCLARSFKLSDAVMVAPLDFLRLPLIAVAGALLYAEPLDPLVLMGGAVILAGNLWSLTSEHRRQKQSSSVRADGASLALSDGSVWTAHVLMPPGRPDFVLDTSSLHCPLPILKAKKAYRDLPVGRMMEVIATDPLAVDDFRDFCAAHKATLVLFNQRGGTYRFLLRRDG
jgi:drug/metabolite transporter (DMT)-like permease/TusA-related sulfurtransferase